MQGMYNFQTAAQQTPEQQAVLPSMNLHSMLPREWPLARMVILYRQVNKYLRTTVWRRVAEYGLRGEHFENIPTMVHADLLGDLIIVCNALARPLAELFSFLHNGHPHCAFVDQTHLALYADFFFARVEALCVQVLHKSP